MTFSIGLTAFGHAAVSGLTQVKKYLTQLGIGFVFIVAAYKLAFSLVSWAGLIMGPLVFVIDAMKSAARVIVVTQDRLTPSGFKVSL